jgi:hypothetical protein
MSIILLGSTSGSVTLQEPAIAGTTILNLPATSGTVDAFPSGTAILFQQTAAPTGWTKSTTHNNKALRVVSGTASSGGTVGFTTAFASQAVNGTIGGTAITTAQMPAHNHGINDPGHSHGVSDPSHNHGQYQMANVGAPNTGNGFPQGWANYNTPGTVGTTSSFTGISINGAGTGISTQNNGSGSTHNHTFTGTAIDLAVQYVDAIICTKD